MNTAEKSANWFPLRGCCCNCPQFEGEKAYQEQNETTAMICCPQCPCYESCKVGVNPAKKPPQGLIPASG